MLSVYGEIEALKQLLCSKGIVTIEEIREKENEFYYKEVQSATVEEEKEEKRGKTVDWILILYVVALLLISIKAYVEI